MKKSVIAILIVAGIIVIGSLAIGGWMFYNFVSSFGGGRSRQLPIVSVPRERSTNSLAVFGFKGSGTSQASDYAAGFARALAERLWCAPTCVTGQLETSGLLTNVCEELGDPLAIPTFDQAVTMGRSMGTRYVVTGEMKITGSNADISMLVCDSYDSNLKTKLTVSGPVSDLGSLQTKAVVGIISAMKLKPSGRQLNELRTPNFSSSQTILLYGRSMREKDASKRLAMRWKLVESDPKSSFAVLRLFGYYYSSDMAAPQIASDRKLQALLADIPHLFPDNSLMSWYKAMLLVREYKYERAEIELFELKKADPDFVLAHTGLAYVARLRENGELAIKEGKLAVKLWPDNAYLHAMLAYDYDIAANNARHGHYTIDMNRKMSSDWDRYANECLREAMIAVKIDPNCSYGWHQIMRMGLALSYYSERDKAYSELVRLTPKDPDVYIAYGNSFLPQWGGGSYEMNRLFAEAEATLGKGSADVFLVKATLLNNRNDREKYFQQVLGLCNAGIKASKEPNNSLMLTKCQILSELKRDDEELALAQEGYKRWGSLDWSDQLAGLLADKYYKERKKTYLYEAYALYSKYAREVPYDPYAHCHVGWCLSHLGRREEAKKEFLRALELDPNNEMAKEKMKYVE